MTAADVTPIRTPDAAAMLAHVTHLFAHHREVSDGKIELAWTDDRGALSKAQFYEVDQIVALVEHADRLNKNNGTNVYIGAALRDPACVPFGRGKDDDFYALTALYVDLDDPGAAEAAKETLKAAGNINPSFIVTTGKHPHLRAQMWWRLSEPLQDTAITQDMLRRMAAALGGDVKVTNPSRVMRLGGSIAWPVKAGRVTEMTMTTQSRDCVINDLTHMDREFPVLAGMMPNGIDSDKSCQSEVTHAKSGLGLDGKITDGREAHMRNTVLAVFIELVGDTGSIPTVQELYDAAWPQFERGVSFSRPGRGKDEFVAKCKYTVTRFHEGQLPGLKTIEAVVERYQVKSSTQKSQKSQKSGSYVSDDAKGDTDPADTDVDAFETLSAQECMDMEPPRWLIDGVLPETGLLFLYGKPKSGKSFIALDMALRLTHGMDWFGRETRAGGVLYIAGEGAGGLRNRLRAWHSHNDVVPNELFRLKPTAINLVDEDDVVRLVNTVRAQVEDARLVVIDTLARSAPGVDENDAKEIGLLIQACDIIWRELGVLVELVHHSGKDEARGLRGSSALLGAADGVLHIYRDEEGAGGGIEIEAMKDGESGDDIRFKTTQVEWLEGLKEQSSMVVEDGAPPPKQGNGWPAKDVCREILRAISDAWTQGNPWSLTGQTRKAGRYAPLRISATFSVPADVVVDMIETWLNNDILVVEIVDAHSRIRGLKQIGSID